MNPSGSSKRIFYFVADSFPAWRVDLAELFSVELRKLGLDTTWSMRRDDSGMFQRVWNDGQEVFLPFNIRSGSFVSPMARRVGELLSELLITVILLFGKRYDAIQVRDDRYTAAFFALLAARIRSTRFTYWLSFPFPENDLLKAQDATGVRKHFLALRGRITRWWLYRVVLRHADHVFVQSERMKQDVAAYGISPEKMTAVPMGIPRRLADRTETPRPPVEPGKVVYVGTLARTRRLETLIEAFAIVAKEIPHARLHLVGRGDVPEDHLFLEQVSRRMGIEDRVVFHGFLPIEEAWAIAASAAVCISPIFPTPVFDVASPTKLIEYMALGRPVVANDHPEQSAILRASGAGLCVPWGAASFADAIVRLLQHPEEAEAMGSKGPAWVVEHRRYDRIAQYVFRVYSELFANDVGR